MKRNMREAVLKQTPKDVQHIQAISNLHISHDRRPHFTVNVIDGERKCNTLPLARDTTDPSDPY